MAVDLGAAGAALPGFAVPADGEVRGLRRLYPMDHVEDDHARIRWHGELDERAARVVASPHLHPDVRRGRGRLRRHDVPPTAAGAPVATCPVAEAGS